MHKPMYAKLRCTHTESDDGSSQYSGRPFREAHGRCSANSGEECCYSSPSRSMSCCLPSTAREGVARGMR